MRTLPADALAAIWPPHGRYASVTWQVSDVCNYSCSYCNPGNFGARHRNLDTEAYIRSIDEMLSFFRARGYKNFRFFFSGGEPTVWPPLIPVLEHIRREVPRALIAINTNLSKPLAWWEKHHTLFNDIVASFHIEHCDQENYLRNAEFLQDRMDYLVYRLLMHDARFPEVVSFAETLKARLDNFQIEYAALMEALSPHAEMHVYQEAWKREFVATHTLDQQQRLPKRPGVPPSDPSYVAEFMGDLRQESHNSNRLVSENKNDFRGWKCWINDALFIGPDGQVRAASCDMGSIVGNIHQGGFTFQDGPVVCRQARCNCGTDIGIRKAHPDYADELERTDG